MEMMMMEETKEMKTEAVLGARGRGVWLLWEKWQSRRGDALQLQRMGEISTLFLESDAPTSCA